MIYIAAPFFSDEEIAIYDKIIEQIKSTYHEEVFVPREHIIPDGEKMSNAQWGKAVFDMDVEAIDRANLVIAINHGMYSDSGTAWECGYAYAKGIPVHQILINREDNKDFSLMMINSSKKIISTNKAEINQK